MKFCSSGMLEATRVKMSDSEERVNKNTSDIPSTAKKFTKRVCCTCKVAFLLIRPIAVFFYRSRCLRRLALYDFIFCLSKL